MSLIAGIYSRKQGVPVAEAHREHLRSSLSRDADDLLTESSSEQCFMVKVDLGAFGSAGHFDDGDGNFAMLTGEPLLAGNDRPDRVEDLRTISNSFKTRQHDALSQSRGSFTVADYSDDTLTLVTDRIGIRPVYYWMNDDILVFASALRVLETMPAIPMVMDLRAVTETAGLGYAIGDRTAYKGIHWLGPAGIIRAEGGKVEISAYADWNDIPVSKKSEDEMLREAYECFTRAVSIRQRGDTGAIAYLSGGLDSRCVTASLRAQAPNVYTFNFARENTQDQIFGRQYAEKAGVIHSELPRQTGDQVPDYSLMLARAWNASEFRNASPVERPGLAWSGEGGSVNLGHVHVGPRVPHFMRSGDYNGGAQEFLVKDEILLPTKLFRSSIRDSVSTLIRDGIVEQMEGYSCPDPARKFYLFMLLNDQRRKLTKHFEDLDLHRMEFQLPFFDADFVEMIMTVPLDLCVRHKFYVKWLELFPAPAAEIAWQSYPGHVPCAIEPPPDAGYQWDRELIRKERAVLKRELKSRGAALLSAKDFPSEILDRTRFGIALTTYFTGLRDYGYLVQTAEVFHKYWKKCSGKYSPIGEQ